MPKIARIGVLFLFFLLSPQGYAQTSPFQIDLASTPVAIRPGETKSLLAVIKIPPAYFVYREKTELVFINTDEIKVQDIRYPETRLREDPFFKKKLEIFEGEAPIAITFEVPLGTKRSSKTLEALLKLQGCSDTLCYPEETHLLAFHFDIGEPQGASSSVSSNDGKNSFSLKRLIEAQDFTKITREGLWIMLAIVFLGGFLTSLTPCVLPVIPITLMIIGVRAKVPVRKNLILSSSLVFGLALTYALFGVLAVSLGKSLGFVFQEQWFVLSLALLYFLLSLSMFGFYEIRLPQSLSRRLNAVKGHGKWGAFLSGIAAGILAAPCAGPVIGALLIFVAGTKDYFKGFFLLFVYALGMGLLFILLGTGYGTLEARFRGGSLALWTKRFLGLLLLLGSLFYLNTVVPIDKGIAHWLQKPDPILWIDSEPNGLMIAKAENKAALIDFYADWCAPCKELEIGFFRKAETVKLLKEMVPIRIDATFSGDPKIEALLEKYNVVGWPTIVFVDPDGNELEDLKVVSYNPKLLLENMKKALETMSQFPLPSWERVRERGNK